MATTEQEINDFAQSAVSQLQSWESPTSLRKLLDE